MWTRPRGRARSVDRGTRRPGIEPRNRISPQAPRTFPEPKATPAAPQWRGAAGLGAVEDPEHAWRHFAREPGGPVPAHSGWRCGPRWEVRGPKPSMNGAGSLTVL